MAGALTGASATLNSTLYTVNGRKMRQIRIKFPNQTTPVTLADNTTAFSLCFLALDTTNNPSFYRSGLSGSKQCLSKCTVVYRCQRKRS